MRGDLSGKIMKRCPIIYRGAQDGPDKKLMCFGFECGSGWFEMILLLSESVEKVASNQRGKGEEIDNLPIVTQVKEKFVGLRFYVHHGTNEVYDMISKAEDKSYHICEICGGGGELRVIGGVFMTRCHEHCNQRCS
jgi:hypothetical protein